MTVQLKIAREEDSSLWDDLVKKSPNGTLFHTWKFLKIIENHQGCKLYPMIGFEDTNPLGIYPLFLEEKFLTRVVLSPPLGGQLLHLGPAFANYDTMKQSRKESLFVEFQQAIDKFLQSELKYSYVRIRTSPFLVDSRPMRWAGYKIDPMYTYVLNISDTSRVWDSFNKKIRAEINKAEKYGLIFREGNEKDLDIIKGYMVERFFSQGYWRKDYSDYLHDIYNTFNPNNLKIFMIEYEKKAVTGVILLLYKDTASMWIGVPKTNIKGVYPNDLLIWKSIKWCSENGYKKFDIMEAGDTDQLTGYKSRFNPDLVIWYQTEKYSSVFYSYLRTLSRLPKTIRNLLKKK